MINEIWSEHENSNLHELKCSIIKIWLTDDGQFNYLEFCGKYTYTLIYLNSTKIIDFKLIKKRMLQGNL